MTIDYRSATAAQAAGDLDAWRESYQENVRTARAIDDAIRAHFDGMRLDRRALADVLDACDRERVAIVLALTVLDRWNDGRWSPYNKTWSTGIRVIDGSLDGSHMETCRAHTAILDGFLAMFRREAAGHA